MRASIYKDQILKTETNRKAFAVLLDPDNLTREACLNILALSETHHVDYFFMGGSLVTTQNQAALISLIKEPSSK